MIIKYYNAQRIARHLPLAKLSHLLLGHGFLPRHGLEEHFEGAPDYLSMLTDLTALRYLTLLNHSGKGFYSPPTVDLEVFKKATNFRLLAVATSTPDVERLLGFQSLAKSLAEFTVFSPFRKAESGNIEPYLNSPDFAWERISLYC